MSDYAVQPLSRPLNAVVRLPGSKSLTNRALVTAALAAGQSALNGVLLADDTQLMTDVLRALGVAIHVDERRARAIVVGCGGHIPVEGADLYCGNAGTVMRFVAALCAAGHGTFRLDGSSRMRQRPIGELVDALRRLSGRVQYEQAEGYPPIVVHAHGLGGGEVVMVNPPSSQMVSALLLTAPCARQDLLLRIEGEVVSRPYIAMTLELMRAFGVEALEQDMRRFIVPAPQAYQPTDYHIEPDASNAACFLAAPLIAGGRVTVEGLGRRSVQGDVRFADVLERMGAVVTWQDNAITVERPAQLPRPLAIDIDLNDMPDTVQPLAVLALFAGGTTVIRNVENLRLKETDRLKALASELAQLGATVIESRDGLAIEPPRKVQPAAIATYDDHRMAMSFALAGLAVPGIVIRDRECVRKTFPAYFELFERMCAGTAGSQ